MSKKVNKSTTLYTDVGDNKEPAFIFIPASKGYNRLKRNKNKHKWFGHLLTALGGDGNEQDTFQTCLFMWDTRRSTKRHSLKQLK
jgi:hypothetical protein